VEVRGSISRKDGRPAGPQLGPLALVLCPGLLVPVRMRAGQDPPTAIELRILVVGSQAEAEKLLQRCERRGLSCFGAAELH
jgi:hypothetical protein